LVFLPPGTTVKERPTPFLGQAGGIVGEEHAVRGPEKVPPAAAPGVFLELRWRRRRTERERADSGTHECVEMCLAAEVCANIARKRPQIRTLRTTDDY
jgi:hypothetical protein